MLYRHVQPLFISSEYSAQRLAGPTMRVRPLDTDAPDHALRFVLWGALSVRPSEPATRALEAPPTDPKDPKDPKGPDVIVVTPPPVVPSPKLLIEMSPDGEGWIVQSELTPRDRPYLVTVSHMLRYLRVRLDGDGAEARGYALVMANGPFQLDGGSPIVVPRAQCGTKDPVVEDQR